MRFIFKVLYRLSYEGRGSYEPGGYGLINPERLRLINEALHKVSDHGYALANDAQPRRSDKDFVQLLMDITDGLQLGSSFLDSTFKRIV